MIIPTEDNTKTISDLREKTTEILLALNQTQEPQFVFYKSRPQAVLLAIEKYKSLMELLENYQDALDASEVISDAKAKNEKLYSFIQTAKIVGYKIKKKSS